MSSIQQSPILTVGSVFILSFRFSVFCFYFAIMSFGSFLREEIALLLLFCFLFFVFYFILLICSDRHFAILERWRKVAAFHSY